LSFGLSGWLQGESVEIDWSLAGLAAAGPALEERLEQVDCLG
jgi:hypothetical protein